MYTIALAVFIYMKIKEKIMDMRSNFKFIIEGKEFTIDAETWQEGLAFFLESAQAAGFEGIDTKRVTAINEIARSGKITL